MDEEQVSESVAIERCFGEVKIRATVDMDGPFGIQYLRILQQFDVIEIIERTRRFWNLSDYQPKIVGLKGEGNRIMLSLTISFPYFKTQQEIITETGLHSGSVSRILTGKRGNFAKFIVEQDKSYRLNDEGFQWVRQILLPELEQLMRKHSKPK